MRLGVDYSIRKVDDGYMDTNPTTETTRSADVEQAMDILFLEVCRLVAEGATLADAQTIVADAVYEQYPMIAAALTLHDTYPEGVVFDHHGYPVNAS